MQVRATLAESLLWAGASLCAVLVIVSGSVLANIDRVGLADVVRPVAILAILAVLMTLALMAVVPPLGRVFPMALYAFFAFHPIEALLPDFGYEHIVAGAAVVVCPLALHRALRRVDRMRGAAGGFAVAATMAGWSLVVIAPSILYDSAPVISRDFQDETLVAVASHRSTTASLPDIIYVVPDRYASAATLKREFHLDNSSFYAALEARGFRVAKNAHANYHKTFQSLASTLNGGYLEGFTNAYGVESRDRRPGYDAIENNVVQHRLRKLGYRFLNYGNWWEPTRINPWADVNDTASAFLNNLSEFELTLISRTPTRTANRFSIDSMRRIECHRIQRKFQHLEEVGNGPEPVFVFAHILVPHAPITMNAAGHCLEPPVLYAPGKARAWRDFKAAYVEYLKFFNAAMLRVIDQQMERRKQDGRDLLFVIQSDEGPWPLTEREEGRNTDYTSFTRRELRMKTGIINALRMPGGEAPDFASIATPINNWRIIFNTLVGTRMKMLPHRIHIHPSGKNVYRFCDVTALVTEEEIADGDPAPMPCDD